MDTPSNQIPQFSFDVKPTDIGSGYAAGIAQAGEGLSKGISSALDVMNRSRAAHDTMDAMLQSKILSPEAYSAIKGKSLTAQEGMIGIYANQWIQQQAQQRAMELARQQGAIQVGVERGKFQAMGEAFQKGLPLSGNPKDIPWRPGATTTTNQNAPGTTTTAPPPAPPAGMGPLAPGWKYGYDEERGQYGVTTKGGTFIPHPSQGTPSPGAPSGGLGPRQQASVTIPMRPVNLPNVPAGYGPAPWTGQSPQIAPIIPPGLGYNPTLVT